MDLKKEQNTEKKKGENKKYLWIHDKKKDR